MDYWKRRGSDAAPEENPGPGLILLDLNMPRKDGRDALAEIERDPKLRTVPIVVLMTSKAVEDVDRSFGPGVNSYIETPVAFDGLVHMIGTLELDCFEIVELPLEHV